MDLLWIYYGSIVDLPIQIDREPARTGRRERGDVRLLVRLVVTLFRHSLVALDCARARMWRSVVRGWAGRAGSPVWTRALDPITCRAAAPARSAAVHLAGMQTIQPDLASLWDRASAGLLAGGLLAGLLAPVAALCAGDDDAQLPASGAAAAASGAASVTRVLARPDGGGDYIITDFYKDKKCLACEKQISVAGQDRLRFHLIPSASTPLCPKLNQFPLIYGRSLSQGEVIEIATALNEAAMEKSRGLKRRRESSDETELRLNWPYSPTEVPADFRERHDLTGHMSSQQLQLSVQQSHAAAAAEEAASDSYRRNSLVRTASKYTPEDVGLQMARATMCGGLANSWADEPAMRLFLQMYRATPGFMLPGRMVLGRKLIPQDYENVVGHVNAKLKDRSCFGLGQASDGVTGHRHRSIMSYLAQCPDISFFHRLEYTKGVTKDMAYLVAKHKGIMVEIHCGFCARWTRWQGCDLAQGQEQTRLTRPARSRFERRGPVRSSRIWGPGSRSGADLAPEMQYCASKKMAKMEHMCGRENRTPAATGVKTS